ncbi:uncharacterized protein N7503_004012 [Penicillium pulvis]|uniref:uncharacterized protein n=1 Tax=Penicillium pulvis TaxID=1562058 RepID=UPI002546FD51|nr:uncharacterized protein N7503_004012 [Penicillium pulvis]KAJ5806410.1 hypothetical protein N7503_004012 [Penicillium pulvis]
MTPFLPNEILVLVLDGLEKIQDRVRLLQVCRHWNAALSAKVYSSLEIVFPETLVDLAEALQKNPQLKFLVYELHIPSFYVYDFDEAQVYNRALFRRFLECFTDNDEELTKWEERLNVNNTSAWLTLVLISLPNLEHLNLGWGGDGLETACTLWAVSKIASKSPRKDLPLQHLQKLTAGSVEIKENFPVREFIPFLKLPSIQELRLSYIVDWDQSVEEDSIFGVSFNLPQGVSPVRKLVLRASNVVHGMPGFIAACAHLEHFEYQHSNQAEWSRKYRSYRCRPFHTALSTQKESLRVLRLNNIGVTKEWEWDYNDQVKAQAWFGSLVEFVALKELSMPVRNLLDSTGGEEPTMDLCEILPSSLEILVLTKVDFVEYFMLEGQLSRLIGVKEQQFPQLRKVSLQTFQMEVVEGEEICKKTRNWRIPKRAEMVFRGVRSSCEEHGIEFSFVLDGDYQILADGRVVDDTDDIGGRAHWD